MKIQWLHNFHPEHHQSGNFMFHSFHAMKQQPNIEITLNYVNTRSLTSLFKNFVKIRRLLKSSDIVHVQYGSLLSLYCCILCFRLKIRKIITLRGSDFNLKEPSVSKEFFHSVIAVFFTSISCHFTDEIIVQSTKMASLLKQKYKGKSVFIIPSPISPIFFSKSKNNNMAKPSTPLIYAGVLNPKSKNKRVKLAELAVEELNRRGIDCQLKIASNLDVNEVIDNLDIATLVLLTSYNEGWPNVIKEGLSRGVPFVSTDVSDLKKIVPMTNGDCRICHSNYKNIADEIEIILARKHDNKLLRDIAKKFTQKNFQNQLIKVYFSPNPNRAYL